MEGVFLKFFNKTLASKSTLGEGISRRERNHSVYHWIRVKKVSKSLRKMKFGKTIGPDIIPIKVWKCIHERSECSVAN